MYIWYFIIPYEYPRTTSHDSYGKNHTSRRSGPHILWDLCHSSRANSRVYYCHYYTVRCTDAYTGTFSPIYVPLVVALVGPTPGGGETSLREGDTRAMFLSLSMRASAFTTSSLTMASSSKYSKGATRQRACVTPRARLDAGVGAFGSKAGMTQVFTEDGLCVPVTVIAVREGNVVTQVRIRGNFFVCVRAVAVAVASVSLDPTVDSFIRGG